MFKPKLSGGSLARNPKLVKFIIVHCSATPSSMDIGVDEIRRWHLAQGFSDVGYHYVIRRDGTIEEGRPLGQPGAHCKGRNFCSVGICYVGGVAKDGVTPADTRTPAQEDALRELLCALLRVFPEAEVRGHRDFAAKACPSFDATRQYSGLRGILAMLLVVLFCSPGMVGCRSSRHVTIDESSVIRQVAEVQSLRLEKSIIADSCDIYFEAPAMLVSLPDSSTFLITARSATVSRKGSAETTTATTVREEVETHQSNNSHAEEKKQPAASKAVWAALFLVTLAALMAVTLVYVKK